MLALPFEVAVWVVLGCWESIIVEASHLGGERIDEGRLFRYIVMVFY
jgi:hypothetical protein